MSFTTQRITLPQSSRHGHQEKPCGKCNTNRPPEGGIELGPGRWICARCWTSRLNKRKS